MIVARAPLRISITGGGTDLPAFVTRVGSQLTSLAIDKYVTVIVHRPVADDLVRAKYGRAEEVSHADQLRHELIRPVLQRYGLHTAVEVLSCADVPSGTGLGSSGAFLVALLAAVRTLTGADFTPAQLAAEAVAVEQDEAHRPVGFQDPFSSAFGGLRRFVSGPSGPVQVSEDLGTGIPRQLGWFRLYYTGVRRESTPVLRDVQRSYAADRESKLLGQLADSAHAEKAFLAGDIDAFSDYVNESWRRKQQASPQTTSAWIEELLDSARRIGARAGKAVGAGGGGFVLVVAPACEVDGGRLDRRMTELGARPVPFAPAHHGVRVVCPPEGP